MIGMSSESTTPRFRLQIPKPISRPDDKGWIEADSSIVIVGANGTGKTRLGAWIDLSSEHRNITHRVAAQKSLMLPMNVSPISVEWAEAALLSGYQQAGPDLLSYKSGHRWGSKPHTHLLNDYDQLLIYLFSEDYEKSTLYRQESRRATSKIEVPFTKLDKIQRLWQAVLPHRELLIHAGKIETKVVGIENTTYPASEMSDGERVVFYLIGQCLSAPEGGVIIIDEPELHVHRSIQASLWNAIEAERSDCLFVYLTHDLDFAATRINATKVWLRQFDGTSWDWQVLPDTNDVPEEVLFEILGSRKPILFVEGDRSSLDYFLFSRIYNNRTVIPVGSCDHVIHSTRTFASLKSLHNLDCFGLIDPDHRQANEIEYLKTIGIFTISVSEVENLLLTPEVIAIVAKHLHFDDVAEKVNRAGAIIIRELTNQKELAISARVARRIELLLSRFNNNAQGLDNIKAAFNSLVNGVDIEKIHREVEHEISNIISTGDHIQALKVYHNKGLIAQVSHVLGQKDLLDYIKRLLGSPSNKDIIDAIKQYIPTIPAA